MKGRRMTAGSPHHRRLGQRRRRRHPGRPQDLLRARRLRQRGDHRPHRAEHAAACRASTPSPPDFVARSRSMRCSRHGGRRGQDRHARHGRRHRGGGRRRSAPGSRASSSSTRSWSPRRRPPPARRTPSTALNEKLLPLADADHAQPARGRGAAGRGARETAPDAGRGGPAAGPGRRNVLLKGGHQEGEDSPDLLLDGGERPLAGGAARRHPEHPRHRLHALLGDHGAAGPRRGPCRRRWPRPSAWLRGDRRRRWARRRPRHGPVHHFHAPLAATGRRPP